MQDLRSRGEERDQAVKFGLGIGNFAGTSHASNSHDGSSLFEFLADGMFPEESSETYYTGLWHPRRGPDESVCWEKDLCPVGQREWGILLEASTLWRQRWDAPRRETEEGPSGR